MRRLKGSTDSVHYLERYEVNGLKLLQRQQQADGIKGAYVFINERGRPFGRMGIGRMIERAGEAAGLPCIRGTSCNIATSRSGISTRSVGRVMRKNPYAIPLWFRQKCHHVLDHYSA